MKLTGGSYHPHGAVYADGGERTSRASAGSTLRDKFADTALRSLIGSQQGVHWGPKEYAACAYSIADAMIAERAK